MLVGSPKYNIGDAAVALGDASRAATPVIQNAISPNPGSATSQNPSFAYPNPVKQGNVLLCTCGCANGATQYLSAADSVGSQYQSLGTLSGGARSIAVFQAVAQSDGPNTVTISTSLVLGYQIGVMEIDGSQYLPTLDGPVLLTNAGITSSPATAPLTTTQGNDLLISFTRIGISPPFALPVGWYGYLNFRMAQAYMVDPSGVGGATFQPVWTGGTAGANLMGILALKINPYKPPVPPGPKKKRKDGWPGGWPGGGW